MKWNNPEIEITKFDDEQILSKSAMSVDEARTTADITGEEKSFLDFWKELW